MIKIIQTGTRRKRSCEECGCLFSFEEEDVQAEASLKEGWQPREKFVECPQCHAKVVIMAVRGTSTAGSNGSK